MKAFLNRWLRRLELAADEAELARFRANLRPGQMVEIRYYNYMNGVNSLRCAAVSEAVAQTVTARSFNGGAAMVSIEATAGVKCWANIPIYDVFPPGWSQTHAILPKKPGEPI